MLEGGVWNSLMTFTFQMCLHLMGGRGNDEIVIAPDEVLSFYFIFF